MINDFGFILGPTTKAQEDEALDDTRKTLATLRDLCREMDLPATAINVAAEIYTANLAGLFRRDEQTRMIARSKKMQAILSKRYGDQVDAGPFTPFGVPQMHMRNNLMHMRNGVHVRYNNDVDELVNLNELDDDALEAEYQRIVVGVKTRGASDASP